MAARPLHPEDELALFEQIVHGAGKQHLGLHVHLVSRATMPTLVVCGPNDAVAYQARGAWTKALRDDLESGRFG